MLLINRALDAVKRPGTSQRLAIAIRKIGKKSDAPVIFARKQSIDANTEQVEHGISKRAAVFRLAEIAKCSA
ncbi:hypothetical protein ACE10Z_34470 [Bradyrhizobium sp. Pha-3]|uniref:hypothetical protein n=1 Tax=Bradyrhizobium sp. Pha-3 TaxID=208375 RepID=UPI0035D48B60